MCRVVEFNCRVKNRDCLSTLAVNPIAWNQHQNNSTRNFSSLIRLSCFAKHVQEPFVKVAARDVGDCVGVGVWKPHLTLREWDVSCRLPKNMIQCYRPQ